jgi:hypothetical protein
MSPEPSIEAGSSRPTAGVTSGDLHRRRARALVPWGLVAGLLTVLVLLVITPREWHTTGGRGGNLEESMLVLQHGGPLLVGRYYGTTGGYYSLTAGDDEGEFVYVPALARLFGVGDPLVMFRYLYIALVALTAALYPAVFFRLTGSLLAAAAAPLLFLVFMVSIGFLDMYWVPAWGALTLLPLIFLLARRWPRYGILAVALLALGASWMSSVRSDSGLGIALALALLLALRGWRWWRLLPALAMVAVIYISVGTFAFGAIRADRDRHIGSVAAKSIAVATAHSLWFEVYAGLGYLENDYGLRYDDVVPGRVGSREAPGATRFSTRFEAGLRRAYLRFVRRHPLEVARQYGAKLLVAVADTAPYLLIVLLMAPAMLLLGPDRRLVRRWALLALPVVAVELVPTLVAVPMESYEQGLYGALGVLDILGLCWALRWLDGAARASGGVRQLLERARRAVSARSALDGRGHVGALAVRSARLSACAVAVLIAVSVAGYFVRRDANRWQGTPSGVLMELYPFRK